MSPGRTGLSHLRSSKPSAPVVALPGMAWSQSMRMNMAPVCQPLAMSPPNMLFRAASSSRWKGWGSNCRAYSMISSRVTAYWPKR
jgi:hypothetical protein